MSLVSAGHAVNRIGFNQGDAFFWPDSESYKAFDAPFTNWAQFLRESLSEATDLVVYSDTRPFHAEAIRIAREIGIVVHCFEEGYLRPYWITYERDGSNGNSEVMSISFDQMESALEQNHAYLSDAPAQWGAMWHHTWAGCQYHFNILFRNKAYQHYRPHRSVDVRTELALHITRLLRFPLDSVQRRLQTARLLVSGAPFHLVLLQLSHDASVQDHSDFSSMIAFAELCLREFAAHAPIHQKLVFKAHPLEDGREPLERVISEMAKKFGVQDRTVFIPGGKLGPLLDGAMSAVTVNSTAGQQALWRGLPLKALGRGVYCRHGLVSNQSLGAFFADPEPPDQRAYYVFRQFLLETSQIAGGFYTRKGRANARRLLVDRMLAPLGPYQARMPRKSKELRLVASAANR